MAEKISDPARQLEQDIRDQETRLQTLRDEYMKLTGHMPVKLNDFEWKWSTFMGIGFAWITMIVYLLGIAKAGKGSSGIPSFFFGLDIEYFGILTMFGLLMVMMPQARKFKGLQTVSYILGFWCSQWLFYDWAWYAYLIGIRSVVPDDAFWWSAFGRDFLIVNPPMWLFLTLAIIGACIGIGYTFTFPRRRRELIPPMLWIIGVYFLPTILHQILGVSACVVLIVSVCIVASVFALIAIFVGGRVHRCLPEWRSRWREKRLKLKISLDPLGFPFMIPMVGLVATLHMFLVAFPAAGLFIGLAVWYVVPIYYLLVHSTGIAKKSLAGKIAVAIILANVVFWFIFFASILPLGEWVG
ncbi:MAG: hypothetical protein Q6373_022980 [Candidatus Sigynarchaeota archaeon]